LRETQPGLGSRTEASEAQMPLLEFLTPEAVVPHMRATAKKPVLHELAAHAARLTGLDERTIFEALLQRERLGSTGIGDGIAIPHGKLPGLQRMFGLFAKIEKPIDFEALDSQPVDLVFLLLAPEGAGADHLKALARVARALREPGAPERLRKACDADVLYAVLTQSSAPRAA
jgi:nitrogen PTS system EIIA component